MSSEPVGHVSGSGPSVLLTLWPTAASGKVETTRYGLNPESCAGATFRHRITGWGLIQLQLGGVRDRSVVHSHTNHNSRERVLKWALPDHEMGDPDDWDWAVVRSTSSKLNRFIRKIATSKIGSRPVLPEASNLISEGYEPRLNW